VRRFAATGLLAAALFMLASVCQAQGASWRMALIPYLSPNVLIPLFQPLAQHLASESGHEVDLFTAPSIRAHVERITRAEYDIVFTAPHFGRLAQLEAGYVPIGSFERPLVGVLTVRRGGPIASVADLRGKAIAINDRLVLNSIVTLQELARQGIGLEEIRIVPAASQNSALLSVANGDVDAAITVNFALGQVPAERQKDLQVLFQTPETPGVPSTLILVHPTMPASDRDRLEAALKRFARTETGQQFLRTSHYRDVAPVTHEGLLSLDRYLPELRRLIAVANGS